MELQNNEEDARKTQCIYAIKYYITRRTSHF